MIRALRGTQPVPELLEQDQDVADIMRGMKMKHRQCARDYDKIARFFECQDPEDLGYSIWSFLRDNLTYREEGIKMQEVSCPFTILKRGWSDCKCYALFTAGILDALKRQGCPVHWVFRYTPQSLFQTEIGHVFVVLNPNSDDIWIDPVLSTFDRHFPYFVKKDEQVNTTAAIGRVGGLGAVATGRSVGNAENDLLSAFKQYSDGLADAINVSVTSGTLNTITGAVVKTITAAIPGVSLALSVVKAAGSLLGSAFGKGSTAAALINNFATNPLTATYVDVMRLFNGRTYNTDQYWMAQYYQFYVLGLNVTGINQIVDSDIMPAAKWFIDRLNVFVSGREHIIALTQSIAAYTDLYKVNADTTMDLARVGPAVKVAQSYFVFNNVRGSWAGTVGVFDPALVALAAQMNESVEAASSQVQAGILAAPPSMAVSSILSGPLPWIAAGVVGLALLFMDKPKRNGSK